MNKHQTNTSQDWVHFSRIYIYTKWLTYINTKHKNLMCSRTSFLNNASNSAMWGVHAIIPALPRLRLRTTESRLAWATKESLSRSKSQKANCDVILNQGNLWPGQLEKELILVSSSSPPWRGGVAANPGHGTRKRKLRDQTFTHKHEPEKANWK